MYLKGGQVIWTAPQQGTRTALDSPTELNSTVYGGAVWLDQTDLRHSTSSMHGGAFWCVIKATRCSYRLSEVFCCLLIQSAQLPRNINVTLT